MAGRYSTSSIQPLKSPLDPVRRKAKTNPRKAKSFTAGTIIPLKRDDEGYINNNSYLKKRRESRSSKRDEIFGSLDSSLSECGGDDILLPKGGPIIPFHSPRRHINRRPSGELVAERRSSIASLLDCLPAEEVPKSSSTLLTCMGDSSSSHNLSSDDELKYPYANLLTNGEEGLSLQEEAKKEKAAIEAKLKAQKEKKKEKARLKKEAKKKKEEEAKEKAEAEKIKAEEEARIKAQKEAAKAEEDARIKAEEEKAAKLKAEEESRIRAEEEKAARIRAEAEEARLKVEAEKAKAEAEAKAQLKAAEEERIKAVKEEAKRKAEAADAERMKALRIKAAEREAEQAKQEEERRKAEAADAERLKELRRKTAEREAKLEAAEAEARAKAEQKLLLMANEILAEDDEFTEEEIDELFDTVSEAADNQDYYETVVPLAGSIEKDYYDAIVVSDKEDSDYYYETDESGDEDDFFEDAVEGNDSDFYYETEEEGEQGDTFLEQIQEEDEEGEEMLEQIEEESESEYYDTDEGDDDLFEDEIIEEVEEMEEEMEEEMVDLIEEIYEEEIDGDVFYETDEGSYADFVEEVLVEEDVDEEVQYETDDGAGRSVESYDSGDVWFYESDGDDDYEEEIAMKQMFASASSLFHECGPIDEEDESDDEAEEETSPDMLSTTDDDESYIEMTDEDEDYEVPVKEQQNEAEAKEKDPAIRKFKDFLKSVAKDFGDFATQLLPLGGDDEDEESMEEEIEYVEDEGNFDLLNIGDEITIDDGTHDDASSLEDSNSFLGFGSDLESDCSSILSDDDDYFEDDEIVDYEEDPRYKFLVPTIPVLQKFERESRKERLREISKEVKEHGFAKDIDGPEVAPRTPREILLSILAAGALEFKLRKVPQEHKKQFQSVSDAAASLGRLFRLKEHIVESESVGLAKQKQDDWKPSGEALVERRSISVRISVEAAAMGGLTQLQEEYYTNWDEDEEQEETKEDVFKMFERNQDKWEREGDIDNTRDERGFLVHRTSLLIHHHVRDSRIGRQDKDWTMEALEKLEEQDEQMRNVQLPTKKLPGFGIQKAAAKKMDRHQIIESLAQGVAETWWERKYRLERPKAVLKVSDRCYCTYCQNPNPFQTHAYKRMSAEYGFRGIPEETVEEEPEPERKGLDLSHSLFQSPYSPAPSPPAPVRKTSYPKPDLVKRTPSIEMKRIKKRELEARARERSMSPTRTLSPLRTSNRSSSSDESEDSVGFAYRSLTIRPPALRPSDLSTSVAASETTEDSAGPTYYSKKNTSRTARIDFTGGITALDSQQEEEKEEESPESRDSPPLIQSPPPRPQRRRSLEFIRNRSRALENARSLISPPISKQTTNDALDLNCPWV